MLRWTVNLLPCFLGFDPRLYKRLPILKPCRRYHHSKKENATLKLKQPSMDIHVLLTLSLSFFFLSGAHSATFTIKNNCPYKIWPATLTGADKPQLSSTGFELGPGASSAINVAAPWSGRVWARTGCSTDSTGKFSCATADCGSGQVSCNGAGGIPPATLVELTLAANGGQDFYDVSLVDGFNLPAAVAPQGGSGACQASSCPSNVNTVCPPELAVTGTDGSVVACKSACLALNQPQYCCTGAFNTAATCPPTNYSKIFKDQCPQAYSYAFDDKSSTFTCSGGANYLITFCP